MFERQKCVFTVSVNMNFMLKTISTMENPFGADLRVSRHFLVEQYFFVKNFDESCQKC